MLKTLSTNHCPHFLKNKGFYMSHLVSILVKVNSTVALNCLAAPIPDLQPTPNSTADSKRLKRAKQLRRLEAPSQAASVTG